MGGSATDFPETGSNLQVSNPPLPAARNIENNIENKDTIL
jgi:hypothetical protein